jgi:Tol biopolymer transport system component
MRSGAVKRSIESYNLFVLCCVLTLLVGCFPDNSIDWSRDGSWGLLRVKGKLFTVDGTSGALTPVEPNGGVSLMPDISSDGKRIAYVKGFACPTVEEGFKLFPATVVAMIRRDAQRLREKVISGVVLPTDLPLGEGSKLDSEESYHRWVVRAMCEDPNALLVTRLGQDKLEECRKCEIGYNRLIVADRADPGRNTTLVTMPMAMYRPRFSPDGRYVAYVMSTPQDKEKAILILASADGRIDAMEVTAGIAMGYDWRPDSKALAYVKQDGDPILGAVEEKVLVDDDGVILSKAIDPTAEASVCTHTSTGAAKQFAGTLFQPLMSVQYGLDGRVLFSSASATIPTAELDQPRSSLFCYDRLTGTVTDILPSALRNQTSENVNYFRLSPDGKGLLVPLQYNRFALYELGSNDVTFPLEAGEGFGADNMPDFVPAWKGNDQITCLVPETSHFLKGTDGQPHRRKEIVVLGTDGQLQKVLSKDWPDEAIPEAMQDKANNIFQPVP